MIELYYNDTFVELNKFNFPDGAAHFKLEGRTEDVVVKIKCDFMDKDDLMMVCMLADTLREESNKSILDIIYCPYSRQDRETSDFEPFSLKTFAKIINGCQFDDVVIHDPHSDVMPALLHNCCVSDRALIAAKALLVNTLDHPLDKSMVPDIIVSPDAGAMKKNQNLCEILGANHVIATKVRCIKTGDITATQVHTDIDLEGLDILVVDDICDGGRTFVELAKVLQERKPNSLKLYVTHGIFSKGKAKILKCYDSVMYEFDLMRDEL